MGSTSRWLVAAAAVALPWVCALAVPDAAAQPAAAAPAASATAVTAAPNAPPPARPLAGAPPAEAFFSVPRFEQARLSPSGRYLAITSAAGGQRTVLAVFDLARWGEAGAATAAANFSDADIRDFEWVNDERLVFRIIDREEGGGSQQFAPGLFSVHRDGSGLRTLVRMRRDFFVNERRIGREPLEWNHELLHVADDGSDEVIVGEWRFDASWQLEEIIPKRLNVVDGRTRPLAGGAPPHAFHWWFDAKGEPRFVGTRHKGKVGLHWKADGGAPWKRVAEHDAYRAPFRPVALDAAGTLYVNVAEGPNGEEVLKRFDPEAGRPHPDVFVRTAGFDAEGDFVSETPGSRMLGVRVETDAETTVWFDARLKALQEKIDERLPGRINRLTCRRCDHPDATVLVRSWSDRDPGELLVYKVATGTWLPIGRLRPGIEPRAMGLRDFHRIRARDGLEMPVWVTMPAGQAKPKAPLPAVVLVHGGPWVRGGHWRWDAMSQFLASRGYVVIEPEFRGSTGYGARLFRAGLKQWGLAMQDDLVDALQWAVSKGWVDPARACIAGGSYGGYATLMGLVRHPDRYRCGAAWVAVTDPRLRYEWSRASDASDEVRDYDLPALVGDPVADAAQLRDTAPVEQAARIKAPVLLAMGGEDRRVPLVHGEKMRDALRAAGNAPEWVLYPEEGHGWFKVETRIDFANRLERFLARHLK